MEQTMPVTFNTGAIQTKFHPCSENELVILSNSGTLQTCRLNSGHVYDTRYLCCRSSPQDSVLSFDVSNNGECLVVADGANLMHLWQSKGGAPPKVNAFSVPVEVPPLRAQPLFSKAIDDLENPFKSEPACPEGCPTLGEDADGCPLLSRWPDEEGFRRCVR